MYRNRIFQFFVLYSFFLLFIFLLKIILGLSDYIIPSPGEIWQTASQLYIFYFIDTKDTFIVAIIGHMLSIIIAIIVASIGRLKSWVGLFIKAAAYNIQAYPIVAVAPIIFILLGDGYISRLLIAAMICYFPLLLSFIGIFTEPIHDIEHFFRITRRLNFILEIKIRAFENINKIKTVVEGSATLAIVVTIVAEFISSDKGIGRSISIALSQSDLAKVLTALFMIGIFTSIYLYFLEYIGNKIKINYSTH